MPAELPSEITGTEEGVLGSRFEYWCCQSSRGFGGNGKGGAGVGCSATKARAPNGPPAPTWSGQKGSLGSAPSSTLGCRQASGGCAEGGGSRNVNPMSMTPGPSSQVSQLLHGRHLWSVRPNLCGRHRMSSLPRAAPPQPTSGGQPNKGVLLQNHKGKPHPSIASDKHGCGAGSTPRIDALAGSNTTLWASGSTPCLLYASLCRLFHHRGSSSPSDLQKRIILAEAQS